MEIDISVLQGSILGVILFLVYINDLPNATDLYKIIFADDSTCLAKDRNLRVLKTYLETEIQKLTCWFRANKLALSMGKTQFMVFHSKFNREVNALDIYINNNDFDSFDENKITRLTQVPHNSKDPFIKMLGCLLDEKLSFQFHLNHVATKISGALGLLNRAKHLLNKDSLRLLYFALIHSHINYCSIIYFSAPDSALKRIVNIQKRAIRTISKKRFNSHCEPIFKEAKILPFDMLIKFNILCFMWDHYNKKLPDSILSLFSYVGDNAGHGHDLRNQGDYYVGPHRFEYLKKFPFLHFTNLWNNFEPDFKYINSKSLFRLNLKEYFLNELRSSINCQRANCLDCRGAQS